MWYVHHAVNRICQILHSFHSIPYIHENTYQDFNSISQCSQTREKEKIKMFEVFISHQVNLANIKNNTIIKSKTFKYRVLFNILTQFIGLNAKFSCSGVLYYRERERERTTSRLVIFRANCILYFSSSFLFFHLTLAYKPTIQRSNFKLTCVCVCAHSLYSLFHSINLKTEEHS